jgi:hypothetical protein
VVNGNFDEDSSETTSSPAGWTVQPAASGSDYFFGPGFGFAAVSSDDDIVSQNVTVQPGCQYQVTYTISNNAGGPYDFNPSVNGEVLRDANGTSLAFTEANPQFGSAIGVFTASSGSATLTFGGYDNPDAFLLTNVSIST